MKTINKLELSRIINKKIGKAVAQKLISDIISIVSNYIIDEVTENRPVSINNFGTFSIRTSEGLLLSKGKDPKKMLSFKVHMRFYKLWHIKQNRFRKSKKFKKNLKLKNFVQKDP